MDRPLDCEYSLDPKGFDDLRSRRRIYVGSRWTIVEAIEKDVIDELEQGNITSPGINNPPRFYSILVYNNSTPVC